MLATDDAPGKAELPTVPLDLVTDALRAEARVGLVFMDACRNDPLIVAAAKSTATAGKGFRLLAGLSNVPVSSLPGQAPPAQPSRAGNASGNASGTGPTGILIAYSTDPGNVARDGLAGDKLSPFTRALTTHVRTPGLTMSEIMARVSTDVAKRTDNKQTPWNTSSLTAGTYQFSAKPKAPTPPISGISIGAGGNTF